ncbi:hypothetical protein DL93DRAFT_2172249 [Clavulina sp. PMI_390]|nr:hypothetical protein DL93DRAFT_2172249 [Clavulina sp. PMI_390]
MAPTVPEKSAPPMKPPPPLSKAAADAPKVGLPANPRPTPAAAPDAAAPKPGNEPVSVPMTGPIIPDLDLLPRIKGMYRLLELFSEQGSGGVVDKIIISQESVSQLVEQFYPGAYSSLTKIDFSSLDQVILQPIGVYGSIPPLVDFLEVLGAVDPEIKQLLLAPPNEMGRPQPSLKTGIYFLPDSAEPMSKHRGGYVIFWPEYTTWDDNAISTVKRNRVTFMRYLTKLADQVVSLMAKEHSDTLVWDDEKEEKPAGKKAATHNRLYTFATAVPLLSEFIPTPEEAHLAPRVVAGEARQALIAGVNIPERVVEHTSRRTAARLALQSTLKEQNIMVQLEADLSVDGINHLLELGLRNRHKKLGDAWKKDLADLQQAKDAQLSKTRHEARHAFDADLPRLKTHIRDQMIARLVSMYPFVADSLPTNPDEKKEKEEKVEGAHHLHALSNDLFRRAGFHDVTNANYQVMKQRLIVASEALQGKDPTVEEYAQLDEAVVTGVGYMDLMKTYFGLQPPANPNADPSMSMIGAFVKSASTWAMGGYDEGEAKIQNLMRRASRNPDPAVLDMVANDWGERVPRSSREILSLATSWVLEKLEVQSNSFAHRMSEEQFRAGEPTYRAEVEHTFGPLITSRLAKMKAAVNKEEVENGTGARIWKIHSIVETRPGWIHGPKMYNVVETAQIREPAHVAYTVYPMNLAAEDVQALNANSAHVPKPVVRPMGRWNFAVPLTASLRYIQLFANGRCLVVIDDLEAGKVNVFLEEDNYMADAINSQKTKKRWDMPRVGEDYMFTVNEPKRLLALYSKLNNRLHTFVIDEHFLGIQSRSDIDLRRWLGGGEEHEEASICSISFLTGSEELAITDSEGHARVFSLVTEQFRPASLRLPWVPEATHSAPDGSCLFFLHANEETNSMDVRVYHSASFGTNQEGTSFSVGSLAWSQGTLTSFGPRSNAYLVAWSMEHTQLTSVRFEIKTRISEFSFKAQDRPRQKNGGRETRHNSLMDIHSEIWTKFPVASTVTRSSPAAQRETPLLQFITDSPDKPFAAYFAKLIQQFEKSTQKPTQGKLEELRIEAVSFASLHAEGHGFEVTSYPAGKWLVELLCLIPIHLAITSGNRFIPLANGVNSAEFERSLLGADVMQIANSITLGWYESIFASYMATKPVKVVSSMGEQSVGKSYALNHFVDTSFAGSAMRCTEGAWLSVTPTDDELVVALDFEGIHSIERSAQEDMLLVLLNVAISNLVLFRNNFALSRDLAGLFTSFQSSTSLINPDQNPTLFQSILCIIIKDVTDGDSDEIVGEFFGKFQRIVADEQEDNFISKLHRGKLDILPWPVIQSREFYDLMTLLKDRLDDQEPSHGNASMFLQTLKTLMAKLKASDWGALDQNLASYRAQTLQNMLANALMYGVTDMESTDSQLKNLDTDEAIPHEDSTSVFWLSLKDEGNPYARRDALLKLRESWSTDLERQHAPEADYIVSLAENLQKLAVARVLHVRTWIDSNVSRFSAEHAEIRTLRRHFETLSPVACAVWRENGTMANTIAGQLIVASTNAQWTRRTDAASTLAILAIISGAKVPAQSPLNTRMVNICATQIFTLVDSSAISTPSKETAHHSAIFLVSSTAARNTQSTHNGAVHLCGQEHSCEDLCASPGICHVATEPKSVESTFVGKRERFQFTKYTQVANRLACVQRIPKNKLRHDGPHTHSLKADAFHFCENRCPYCDYVCSLPLGHAQEHSTSHGSMEQTTWTLDGDDDAVREIQGRKFSSGDSGAPMLCSMVCKELGRHAHIAYCRSSNPRACSDREIQHITKRMAPEPHRAKDWITHNLYWARAGFKDPYAVEEQADFAKCDSECAGEEHQAHETTPAKPSYCTLPMFHAPARAAPRAVGYVSGDGHVFECKNPAVSKSAFHVIFIVDRSGSMMADHCRPLAGTPVTARISAVNNNCYGAVLTALYGFWSARETAASHSGHIRRDAYSIILEGSAPETVLENDFNMTADDLLNRIISVNLNHNNDFAGSIRESQRLMELYWSTERTPVVIFLSDGIWSMPENEMHSLCKKAAQLGKPLPFHSVFFGSRDSSPSVLAQMSDIARSVYTTAMRGHRDLDSPATACTYTNAINTIQLSQTFLGLAESMRQTRSSLLRS